MDRLVIGPGDVAEMLGISRARLRALTRAGAIGHVRLGLGTQRQQVGYTPAQIDDFIRTRSMPAAPQGEPGLGEGEASMRGRTPAAGGRKPRQAMHSTPYDALSRILQTALDRGDVVEWKL